MATAKTAAQKVETLAADAQKAATDQFEKMSKSFEDVAAFNQDNMDAFMKSSNIAVKAVEEMNSELMSFSKKSVEEGVAAVKEMTSVKTLPEFVEKQAELAKTTLDNFMKQSAKLNEMFMAAAKNVAEPMNARASAAADMVKSYGA